MKKETYRKAARLINNIETLNDILENYSRYKIRLVVFGGVNTPNSTAIGVTTNIHKLFEEYTKKFRQLITEEIAALEKEFAELSDETNVEAFKEDEDEED